MKIYSIEKLFLYALASVLLSGVVTGKSAYAEDPLAEVKNNIQAKLDGGDSASEAVCQIVRDVVDDKEVTDDEKTDCCEHTITAAVEMELDTQEVIASAIDCGCEPCEVGDAAYNAGAVQHDIYMAGGCTTGGTTGLSYAPDDVEQPTDRPASPFVPRDNDDKRFGFKP